MASLFRPEVSESLSDRFGAPRLSSPPWLTIYTVLFVALGAFALIVATAVRLPRTETVPGWLVPAAGDIRLVAPRSATITDVFVREGQAVEQGEPLFALENRSTLANGSSVDEELLTSIEEQVDQLTQQIEATGLSYRAREVQLEARRQGHVDTMTNLRGRLELQDGRERLQAAQVEQIRSLIQRGAGSRLEEQRRSEILLQVRQVREELLGQLLTHQSELTQTIAEIEGLAAEEAAEMARLRAQLSELRQDRIRADHDFVARVTAPLSGRVATILVHTGQNVQTGAPVLSLLPRDSVLKAQLLAPSRAVGAIDVGQQVRLRFEAFPSLEHEPASGFVEAISQTILQPGDIAFPTSQSEPVYRVTVAIDQQFVEVSGRQVPLQPGLLLHADIVVEERSLFEALFLQ